MEDMESDFEEKLFTDCVSINPYRPAKKGSIVKFVSMDAIEAKRKKIPSFKLRIYKGGSKFRNGDTLFARITPSLEHGKTAYVDFLNNGEVGAGSTEFFVLSPRDGITISEYVYYLSISEGVRDLAIKSMSGTSGRQRVDPNVFDQIIVKLPHISEQERISKVLSIVDSKIELNRQMNKTLESIAQAIFKHWFINFEFPDENGQPYKSSGGEMVDSELGMIPMGWNISNLGKSVEVGGGSTPKTSITSNWEEGSFYWATPKDLSSLSSPILIDTEIRITESGLKSIGNRLYPKGSFLLSSRPPIGYVAITDIATSVNQGIISVPPGGELSPFYMFAWSKENMGEIRNMANGSTFSEISKANFRSLKAVLPKKDIVDRYNNLASFLYGKITLNTLQNNLLQNLLDKILPRLVSGRIRITLEGDNVK